MRGARSEDKRIVIGVFRKAADGEIALNNLDEAEYEPPAISVLGRDAEQVANDAGKTGPLAGVAPAALPARLEQLGLAAEEAVAYRDALAAGALVIAVGTLADTAQSAAEILDSQHAEHIHTLIEPGGDA